MSIEKNLDIRLTVQILITLNTDCVFKTIFQYCWLFQTTPSVLIAARWGLDLLVGIKRSENLFKDDKTERYYKPRSQSR